MGSAPRIAAAEVAADVETARDIASTRLVAAPSAFLVPASQALAEVLDERRAEAAESSILGPPATAADVRSTALEVVRTCVWVHYPHFSAPCSGFLSKADAFRAAGLKNRQYCTGCCRE